MKSQCCSEGVRDVEKASRSRDSSRIVLYCLELLVKVMIWLKVVSLIYKKCSVPPYKILNYLFPAARRKKVPVVSRSLNIFPFRHEVTICDPPKFLEGKNCHTTAQGSVTNPSHSPHPAKCKKTVEKFKF